ncbi:Predicted ATPase [Raoultella terrigena]|uniref:Predicted ATPase n=1 Tax=Raoultella terrigena TaxID=577 RepID=A0A3P8IY49_RAOTE|nr:Predicted ATPase [Raoultella terrigena]
MALLSPRPPAFLAINEPENSLHRQMFPALARLIVEASRYSQIWLTSHSAELTELISSLAESQIYELETAAVRPESEAEKPAARRAL